MEETDFQGLNTTKVVEARSQFGTNEISFTGKNTFLGTLKGVLKDPMIILLIVAAVIYFMVGDRADAIFMMSAIVLVAIVSIFQDYRSRKALEELQIFAQPKAKVIRNGITQHIPAGEIVQGDFIIVSEGSLIPADARIRQSNDFSVNESMLTGESIAVFKDVRSTDAQLYRGSTVVSGLAIAEVNAVGLNSYLGKIGASLDDIKAERSPLEMQIRQFVRTMVIAGAAIFLLVWVLNYYRSHDILDSLLKALTLAMSILPEEIPVAFTTFMALGALRMMRAGVIVKKMSTVETLGSATVICADKTGTITENRMQLSYLETGEAAVQQFNLSHLTDRQKELLRYAMWASETIPFDPMEKALHQAYTTVFTDDERPHYRMIHEYPIGGRPPMMTHLFENNTGERIIAAKGAPEALIALSTLSETEKHDARRSVEELAEKGYRLLAVGKAGWAGEKFPPEQQDFSFKYLGLVAFYDPPKKNMASVFQAFYDAGIKVKIITGDNSLTTRSIAKQTGFRGKQSISGTELIGLDESDLTRLTGEYNIFSRMFPEAKLRIINNLKSQNEIVAMTGDGVNDAPALKAAHIGIAMGKRGTEIARNAAELILMDDDLGRMVDAIGISRRIYTNLKKAIQYIISIHIPIILTVFIPLLLYWKFPNIFTPVHIIFLELIMGPTCSIIYENEPMEKNTMLRSPRALTQTFFNRAELITSILQGLMITVGTLSIYQYAVWQGAGEALTRTMVFVTLISANVWLTLVNRSFSYSIFHTLGYKNLLVPLIIGVTISITMLLLMSPPLRQFFLFESVTLHQLIICLMAGFISVMWFEIVKWYWRKNSTKKSTQ